jgi:formylglycine-generating enzyme required for sulfatase activity/tRNA A-37 threonylcarbamoyl transferase component Bud32
MVSDLIEQLRTALAPAFDVERELGAGGMSRVFVAEEKALHRRVVIKVLPPELAGSMSVERFRREIELAASLQHPHIVPVLQAGQAGELLYYTMPLVEGESLRARIERVGVLPVVEAAQLLRDVADALAYAHRRGVVHRDIKPDNVLVSDHHALVTDFGVAKALTEATQAVSLTSAGIALGTPTYMAPEQAAADPHTDHRADIYALGALAYEMLTGRAPFVGTSPQMIFAAQLMETPEPCARHRPDTPPALDALVMRCLKKQPVDRWQSADELLLPLASIATPSGGMVAVRRLSPALSRRTVQRIAVAGSLLVVVAGAGLWLRARSERVHAILAAVEAPARAGKLDEVYERLRMSGVDIGDGRLAAVARLAAGTIAVTTEPAGATVRATRVSPIAGFGSRQPIPLGPSPVARRTLVAGEYLVQVAADRFQPLAFTLAVGVATDSRVARTLVPDDSAHQGMVHVDGGTTQAVPAAAPVPAFLADRYEVTNKQFLAFVSAGGYRNPGLWPDTFSVNGQRVPRDAALRHFVDRTGLAGPRFWSGGTYAAGVGDHPVVGVSWYEAAAFARWANKQLPSLAQWYRAAVGDGGRVVPWGSDAANAEARANFGLVGTRPIGSFPLGVSPFGCYDMAGNVREWLADSATAGHRLAAGGSWQDPSYMFEPSHVEGFDPTFAGTAIGFRLVATALPQEPRGQP